VPLEKHHAYQATIQSQSGAAQAAITSGRLRG